MIFLFSILAIVGGLCFAFQAPVNTAIGSRTDSLQGTMISFLGGAIAVALVTLFAGTGDLSQISNADPWELVGGCCGVIGVCITIAAMPVLGAALTLTVTMLGQLVMGAIIDLFGLCGAEVRAVSIFRVLGIAVVVAGILFIYKGSKNKTEEKATHIDSKALIIMLLTFISGLFGAIQSPINASLAKKIGTWEGTLVSFVVGFIAVFIVLMITHKGKLKTIKGVGVKPWMLFGGLLGVGGIFLNLYTVSFLGATLQVVCGMVGQLSGGIIIDSFGLICTEKVKINPMRIIGAIIIAAGVIIVSLAEL